MLSMSKVVRLPMPSFYKQSQQQTELMLTAQVRNTVQLRSEIRESGMVYSLFIASIFIGMCAIRTLI